MVQSVVHVEVIVVVVNPIILFTVLVIKLYT